MGEGKGHKNLKQAIRQVLENAELITDVEVELDLDNDKKTNRSFDVCAVVDNCLLIFECKDSDHIPNQNKELGAWKHDIELIHKSPEKINILGNNLGKINNGLLKGLKEIRLCFVFSKEVSEDTKHQLETHDFYCWDQPIVKYFVRAASTLKKWSRYEILLELKVDLESQATWKEKAIQIKQPGLPPETEMYLLGMHPGLLAKIGYVSRRVSTKPQAYQRMINKDRIGKITDFFKENNAFLPNGIIIAFDKDPEVQKSIHYSEGLLSFPIRYCSAWIIDGQHRLYGLANTGAGNWDEKKYTNDLFKLPIVALKSLDEENQNKTFVNINYYQKKINPTLFCDLAAATKDLRNELTWPSLLGIELNKDGPLKNKIKISEFDVGRSISLSSFARYALLEGLLDFEKKSNTYSGPLYRLARFDHKKPFNDELNTAAFWKQVNLLKTFFVLVQDSVGKTQNNEVWANHHRFGVCKPTGMNALLLVLARILEEDGSAAALHKYTQPIGGINFSNHAISKFGGGWKGFQQFANFIIRKINKETGATLRLYRR